jgi:hypothetical protein
MSEFNAPVARGNFRRDVQIVSINGSAIAVVVVLFYLLSVVAVTT